MTRGTTKVEFTAQDLANYFVNRIMPLMKKYKKQHRRPFTSSHADGIILDTFAREKARLISREEGKRILEQSILGAE